MPQRAVKGAPTFLQAVAFPKGMNGDEIALECRNRTASLIGELDELERKKQVSGLYDGTISSLIRLYKRDATSSYQKLKNSTKKRDYDPTLRLIDCSVGKARIGELRASHFTKWYNGWTRGGKELRRAHGAIRKLRTVLSYGAGERYAGCQQAREILSLMRFKPPEGRKISLTYEQAVAIVETALKQKRPSIALMQAIQWDTALRRIHVIGEYDTDPIGGISVQRGQKYWHGPKWTDISRNMIFQPPNVSRNKAAPAHDLKECPLVMKVLEEIGIGDFGPLIVSEKHGLPYWEREISREWREIARLAGVPDDVWSMDTRVGAISEAEAASGI